MDRDFISSLYQGNHYLKTGVFFLGSLLSFGALFQSLGQIRFVFLVALLFVPLLVVEFLSYHFLMKELRHDQYVTGRMRIGRISIIEMKKERVGIELEGIIENKVYDLKYYTLEPKHEQIMENIARYQSIDVEYYPKSNVVRAFHTVYGDKK